MPKIDTIRYGELAIVARQAEVPVRETLEFMTDVIESFNGSEERLKLRSKARQTYAYTSPRQMHHLADSFNTEYGAIRKQWAVPIWTEAQYVGRILEHQDIIICDTKHYDFRPLSLGLLFTSCDTWQIVEISTVTETTIVLIDGAAAMQAAWLVPVRVGWIANTVERPTNAFSSKSTMIFEIDDVAELPTTEPMELYQGHEFYVIPGLLTGESLDAVIEQRLDENDFDLGLVDRRSPWTHARLGTQYRIMTTNATEMRDFKKFLYRRYGKYSVFWMPTFEVNMRVVNAPGTIGTTLIVRSDSYLDYAGNRNHIAIQTLTDGWLFRQIMNAVQIDSTTIQLTLSSALGMKALDIINVSYLGLYRLDTDRIEILWSGAGIADCTMRIIELEPGLIVTP